MAFEQIEKLRADGVPDAELPRSERACRTLRLGKEMPYEKAVIKALSAASNSPVARPKRNKYFDSSLFMYSPFLILLYYNTKLLKSKPLYYS